MTATSSGKFEIVDPTQCENWDDQVLRSSGSSVFLSSAWAQVFKSTYGYQPYYWRLLAGDKFRFLMPMMEVSNWLTGRRAISLPFTDFCQPICPDRSLFEEMVQEACSFARQRSWRTLEFRGVETLLPDRPASQEYYVHRLELAQNPVGLFERFHTSTQRNIKKAERAGVRVCLDSSRLALQEFYRLNCRTRRRHGLPPQPYAFFRTLHEKFILPGKGLLFTAQAENRTIAAAIFLLFGSQVLYKYGASDEQYQSLRANNLLMWKAIEHCCIHHYADFNFGKTEPANEGLRRYKLNWGTKEKTIRYYKFHLQKKVFIRTSMRERHWANSLFAHMPLSLLKWIGQLLYARAA